MALVSANLMLGGLTAPCTPSRQVQGAPRAKHGREKRLGLWNLQEVGVLGSRLKLKGEVTGLFIWVWECVGYEM